MSDFDSLLDNSPSPPKPVKSLKDNAEPDKPKEVLQKRKNIWDSSDEDDNAEKVCDLYLKKSKKV